MYYEIGKRESILLVHYLGASGITFPLLQCPCTNHSCLSCLNLPGSTSAILMVTLTEPKTTSLRCPLPLRPNLRHHTRCHAVKNPHESHSLRDSRPTRKRQSRSSVSPTPLMLALRLTRLDRGSGQKLAIPGV